MPTTYAAAVSLAESQYITPANPHGWVPGFDKEPAKFLQDVVQPYADAGIRLMLHNAFGRGGKTRTFSKRFDGQAASVTAAECFHEATEQAFALARFVQSPGVDGTFLYIGAPSIGVDSSLDYAAKHLEIFKCSFPGCIPIYDNVGDIDSSELCAGSALFAAHRAMGQAPFCSPVEWGIEPNPAVNNSRSPLIYGPRYIYGTPKTWLAKSRFPLVDAGILGKVPIVAIRGDDYKTPDERLAAAREWGPRVEPYNGIVVVHGVSVVQWHEIPKGWKRKEKK